MIVRYWFLFSLGDLRKHLVPKSGDYPSIAQKHFNGAVASLIFHCAYRSSIYVWSIGFLWQVSLSMRNRLFWRNGWWVWQLVWPAANQTTPTCSGGLIIHVILSTFEIYHVHCSDLYPNQGYVQPFLWMHARCEMLWHCDRGPFSHPTIFRNCKQPIIYFTALWIDSCRECMLVEHVTVLVRCSNVCLCVCHLGLASEALCNGKLLWKLRPKLHKFLDRSDPFWCYGTYTLIILFWVCQLGWTIYALMLLNVFAHFGPVVMAMKI